MRILLVEERDQGDPRLAEALMAAMPGVTLSRVAGDDEMRAALAETEPGLLVIAHAAAGDDGALALVRSARAEAHDLPILLVAEDGSEALAVAAWRAGVTDYVPAAERDQLGQIVQRLLIMPPGIRGLRGASHVDAAHPDQQGVDTLHALIDSTGIGLAYLDAGLAYVHVNSVYAAYSGRTPEQMIGRHHSELFPESQYVAMLERVRDTGQPVQVEANPYVYPDHPERGTAYFTYSARPILGPGARLPAAGITITTAEVTEQVRATAEIERLANDLRRQRDLLQVMIDSTDTNLAYLDNDLRFVYLNETYARASAHTVADLIGRKHFDVFPNAENEAIFTRVRDTGEPISYVGKPFSYAEHPEWGTSYWDWTLTPIRDGADDVSGLVLSLTDVTPRVQSLFEQEARLAQRQELMEITRQLLSERTVPGLLRRVAESACRLTGASNCLALHGAAHGSRLLIAADSQGTVTTDYQADVAGAALWERVLQLEAEEGLEPSEGELRACLAPGGLSTMCDPDASLMGARLTGHEGHTCSLLVAARDSAVPFTGNEQTLLTQLAGLASLGLRHIEAHDEADAHANRAEANAREIAARNDELARLAQALEAEHARLSAFFQNAPNSIIFTDREGHVVMSNPTARRLFVGEHGVPVSLDPEGVVRLLWLDGTPCAREDLPLVRAATGETIRSLEMLLAWPDGQQTNVMVTAAPTRTTEDETLGTVAIVQDISAFRRVERDLEERNRQARLFNAVGRALSRSLDREQVLKQVLETTRELVEADAVSIWLRDPEDSATLVRTVTAAGAGAPVLTGDADRVHLPSLDASDAGDGADEPAEADGSRLVLPPYADGPQGPSYSALLRTEQQVIGAIQVMNDAGRPLAPLYRARLLSLASWASIAIVNAELYARAQEAAAAGERSRLANELHDAVSQLLFAARMTAVSLPRLWERDPAAVRDGLDTLVHLTSGALAEMRTLLVELRPTALLEAELGELLDNLTQAMMARATIDIPLEIEGAGNLPVEVRIVCYRIAQEALNNVVKHARARSVQVRLRREPGEPGEASSVDLTIEDDGQGFDPQDARVHGLGLNIMRERSAAIGARLDVTSAPGRGTTVRLRWQRAAEEGVRAA
ncbi:MAG: PAS domain-containing protein [Anaerolineae bacterium]